METVKVVKAVKTGSEQACNRAVGESVFIKALSLYNKCQWRNSDRVCDFRFQLQSILEFVFSEVSGLY